MTMLRPMAVAAFLWLTLLAVARTVEGGVLFASLNKTLVVTYQIQKANPSENESVADAGTDHIDIKWSLNTTFAGKDASYKTVQMKLCYAPLSQVNRGWRKTINDLSLDRSCKAATIATQNYVAAGNSTDWLVSREVPKAIYFIRAYALDVNGNQVGFGQTSNKNKTTNLFSVHPISGRSTSIDIVSVVFSVFAVAALFSFLGVETLLAKRRAVKM